MPSASVQGVAGIPWKLHSSVGPHRDNFGHMGALRTQQGQQRAPSCVSFLQLHLESLKDYSMPGRSPVIPVCRWFGILRASAPNTQSPRGTCDLF